MKKIIFLLCVLSPLINAQSYSQDKKEIYTANNEVENTLGEANNILCTISKLKVEQFIDKGPYRAQVYDSRCDVNAARQAAQNAAQQGNQNQNQASEVEIPSTFVIDVTSQFSEIRQTDYLEVKGWFFQKGDFSEAQESYEGMWDAESDMTIFFLAKVLSGATEEDPNGEIELDFVAESACKNAPYQTWEEVEAAAAAAGVDRNSESYWRDYGDHYHKCRPEGDRMGEGRLDTTDGQILFLGPRGESILMTENQNGRDGIWKSYTSECFIDGTLVEWQERRNDPSICGEQSLENPNFWEGELVLAFSYDANSNASCTKLVGANRRTRADEFSDVVVTPDLENYKSFDFRLSEFPWYAENGSARGIEEKCESTNSADAKLAVWEYGLYTTSDDLRYDMKNPGFELKTEEEFTSPYDDDRTEPIYAWADYWGTHIWEEMRTNVTDTTVFKKVNSDDTSTYNLKQRKMTLRKMSIDNVSLNSLSGTELDLHIEWDLKDTGTNCWWNDTDPGGYRYTGQFDGTTPVLRAQMDNDSNGEDDRCQKERWRSLGVPVDSTNYIYLGYWDAAYYASGTTPSGAFVFDRAVTVAENGRWTGEEDITPFAFTPDEYLEAWDDNRNINDGIDMWRNLWAHGRGQGYEIKADALADPDSELVRRRTEKDIAPNEIAGLTLGCIERCMSGTSFTTYFNEALALIAQGTEDSPASGDITSPYTGPALAGGDVSALPTGPYVRSGADKGYWTQEGVLSNEVMKYQASGDSLVDTTTNTALTLPAKMYELNDPWRKFEGNICIVEPNGVDKDCWGMKNHMTLFDMDKASEVECDKTRDTNNDGTKDSYEYHNDSVVQTSENFRYCNSKLWKMTEYYEVFWDPWVNYQVYDASGALVEISRPEAVTLQLPDDSAFGSDAGRKKTLEYAGFGRLHGFEWTNFNIKTWTDLGEYLDWDSLSETDRQNTRGFPTYVIPDGTIVMGEDGETELKSKFLRGEYYLKPLPSAVGNNIYVTPNTGLDGVQAQVYDSSFVGPVPDDSLLLNNGEVCVDHGEIVEVCKQFAIAVDGTTPVSN